MKVTANPAYAKLLGQISGRPQLLLPWRGVAYRVTTLDYPDPKSILLGEGSFLFGGRWNAPGSFRAVYGSTTDVVAVAESRANAEYTGIPYPFRTPRLLVAIEFNLRKVLDLTKPATLRLLGLCVEDLRAEDWRKVQQGGRRESHTMFRPSSSGSWCEWITGALRASAAWGECGLFAGEPRQHGRRASLRIGKARGHQENPISVKCICARKSACNVFRSAHC